MGFIVVVRSVADNIRIEDGGGDTDDSEILIERDNNIYFRC